MTPLADLLAAHPLVLRSDGKDDSGTVVVIGGPPTCPGAVLLCATAALRVGAGRVQAVVHPEVAPACAATAWELLVDSWDQASDLPAAVADRLADADVVVVGPGHHAFDADVARSIVEHTGGLVILDAGALPPLAELAGQHPVVVAPNTAEAARLVGPLDDEGALAEAITRLTGNPAAVRGARTAVADGDGCWSFDVPPPGLGTPGSGDVHIGILAGLLAGGNPAVAALGWATELHARAGRHAGAPGPVGYLASDVLAAIPAAIADVA